MSGQGLYCLVIFDVDGTLVQPRSGKEFRESPDDWELLPRRKERIDAVLKTGATVAFATNQGGCAFGYLDPIEMRVEIQRLANLLIGSHCYRPCFPERHVALCVTHPKGTVEHLRKDDERRKPNPGMLLELMVRFRVSPVLTLMVGDRDEDEQAARRAGVDFDSAEHFFRDDEVAS